MNKILDCKNVNASYDGMNVLTNLSFSINEGDFLCILGENGSGKSTLVKCLLGIKNADSGEIILGNGLKHTDIGYLPQNTVMQKGFPATVQEVVISGCLGRRGIRPFYSSAEKKVAHNAMEILGISELSSRSCRELSGGQQQRMLLARALCAAKKMILLDEPVTGLDPAASAEMYGLIKELNQNDKMTILMVSHDIERAVDYASHVLHLGKSNSFFGTTEEYATSDVSNKFIGEQQI